MPGGITFDGNSMQTANILTQVIDHGSHPVKAVSPIALAHANRSVIPSIFYPNKLITVSGEILSTVSIADLDNILDTFRSYFTGNNKNLDIDYNSTTRRYYSTPTNVSISRPGGLLYAEFQVQFFCADPFGYNTGTSTLKNDTAITTLPYAPSMTFLGNAPTQSPVITYTLTTVTGNSGGQTVMIGNAATGQTISINRVWTAGDVVVIDTYNKTVTVNGQPSAFTGAFPLFSPGTGSFNYNDPFATRSISFNVTCTPAWL